MKIYISQLYTQPNIWYPFSHIFQKWLGKELSDRVAPSDVWLNKYGPDYSIMIRINAKVGIQEPEFKGPTRYPRDKSIEMSVILPHDGSAHSESFDPSTPLRWVIMGVLGALQKCGLNAQSVEADAAQLKQHIVNDPEMIVKQQPF